MVRGGSRDWQASSAKPRTRAALPRFSKRSSRRAAPARPPRSSTSSACPGCSAPSPTHATYLRPGSAARFSKATMTSPATKSISRTSRLTSTTRGSQAEMTPQPSPRQSNPLPGLLPRCQVDPDRGPGHRTGEPAASVLLPRRQAHLERAPGARGQVQPEPGRASHADPVATTEDDGSSSLAAMEATAATKAQAPPNSAAQSTLLASPRCSDASAKPDEIRRKCRTATPATTSPRRMPTATSSATSRSSQSRLPGKTQSSS